MRYGLRLLLCSIVLVETTAVYADDQLGTIAVWATASGGGTVLVPTFGVFTQKFSMYMQKFGADTEISMTKAQYCSALASIKPPNCSISTYPAAPGIPSASGAGWAGNGCGADPWSTALASGFLTAALPGIYSGDINKPVQGNPSIDFTGICNQHDRGYTTNLSKTAVDNAFANQLMSFCNGSTNQQLCQGFASTYVQAVQKYGADAYQEDQAQLTCASWGNAMKQSGCNG